MKTLVSGKNERLLAWVAERVDAKRFYPGAVGIGLDVDGKLTAAVVYELYNEISVNMHIALETGWSLSRSQIRIAFSYPFEQLGCQRITGTIRADNLPAQRLAEKLGFVQEGRMRSACKDGTDMIMYGMLRDECRWLGVRQ
jgi:RimJ/RimL family protein N-acetyltransferase